MLARLSVCTTEEQRSVIRFLWAEGVKGAEIHFLNHIITGDETWVRRYEPETKRQSMQWKHTSSPSSKKFKSQPSAGKLLLTVFWDSKGPISNKCQLLQHVKK